jgi:hypothetical protein
VVATRDAQVTAIEADLPAAATQPPFADAVARLAAYRRLAGAVLVEAHDEWQVNDRRDLSEGAMALLTRAPKEVAPAQLMPA